VSTAGPERLIYMANQIAAFFASQPGEGQALRAADHLQAFWDPTMRRRIVEHAAHGGEGLSPLAREAVGQLASRNPKSVEQGLARAGESSPGRQPGDDAG
jgi:formate dehydrogenase subunit delta